MYTCKIVQLNRLMINRCMFSLIQSIGHFENWYINDYVGVSEWQYLMWFYILDSISIHFEIEHLSSKTCNVFIVIQNINWGKIFLHNFNYELINYVWNVLQGPDSI